ncbi:hypothetical protein PHMEG_0003465 [Phytophthora megakarya]|uniref:CCHC-type domain-containing protein n=1 Tax=Phytophthora megakarya TaxID=4795 RepID=A0A225WWB7_9STRA|nr:hypothetical protein PHMEG_0003465 [Phytophthora megakarya]
MSGTSGTSGGTGAGATTRQVISSKPPKYTEEGGFDLYHAQIEGYLVQHDCWDVVNGAAGADPANPRWAERNQFARYVLLFDMVPKDSKKVCRIATAREMWNSCEQDKTNRAYASEIRLRRDLCGVGGGRGTIVDSQHDIRAFLKKANDIGQAVPGRAIRQLANMNAAIRDEVMVNTILQGVVDSHCNVVRMFNRNNAGGVAPNLTTTVNVLLGEAETDKPCAAVVTYNEEVENATKVMSQCPAPQNPKNKLKKKGGSGKKAKQENRKCFFCKKKGHLRADCYGWKALQEKKTKESEKSSNQDNGSTAMKSV